MTKIMLVEDDNNLREIYEARLLAEGYEIVSAKDGEEALALAVKEKPDLIISDVMMPKISGFDMLDILRSTPETKNTKVIMMTALSQAEDKTRADKLGADRYLVKSQVTLEDVAKVAREVLGTEEPATNDTPSQPVATPQQSPAPEPLTPVNVQPPSTTPQAEVNQSATPAVEESKSVEDKINQFAASTTPPQAPASEPTPGPQPIDSTQPDQPVSPDDQNVPIAHKKVIEPINDVTNNGPSLSDLLAKEDSTESVNPNPPAENVVNPGGAITPAEAPEVEAEKTTDNTPQPGNLIHPAPDDPTKVAL